MSGPIPILDTLSPLSFRLVIDLTNLQPGVYQITPVLDLIPDQIQVESILPARVEVTIIPAPTQTPPPDTGVLQNPTPSAAATGSP